MNTSSPAITPFWQRLREITLYPSRPAALMTVVLLALLRLLAFLPGVGWIVGLAIWVAVYKYAFEVLRDSANGRTEPPEGSLNVDESLGWGGIGLQFAGGPVQRRRRRLHGLHLHRQPALHHRQRAGIAALSG